MENISIRIINGEIKYIDKILPKRFMMANLAMVFIYINFIQLSLEAFLISNIVMIEGMIFNDIFYTLPSTSIKKIKNKFNSEYKNTTEIYKSFIDSIISPIILLKDEKIYCINDEAINLMEIEKNVEFNNINIYDYLEQKFYKDGLFKIDNIKDYNGVTYTKEKIILKNGKILSADLKVSVIKVNDEELICLSIKDNTPQEENKKLYKEVEKAKMENNQRNEFFTNISHDLKTPINIIYSAIQVMNIGLNGNKIDTIEKYIGVIRQNCYRLLRLVNNIVNANKIELGYCKMKLTNNNIVSLVEDIVTSVSTYVENNDMDIIFDTDVEEKIVACDKDMIERVVLNLISNSVKYKKTGRGSIKINIKDKKDKVMVSVKDIGIGIPENIKENVFNRFVRSNRKEYDLTTCSSGIGLALVKSIIDMHNGNIRIDSKENKGTEIIFDLPCRKVKENKTSKDIYTKNIDQNVKIEFPEIYNSIV